ncbi:PhzF family phenazine biosynthesis protein [Spirillospora sp. NPDC127200]
MSRADASGRTPEASQGRPVTLPHRTEVLFGSAFVDVRDPRGGLGNPFAVVMGADVGSWDLQRRQALAARTGAPETVFVDAVREPRRPEGAHGYELDLAVLTPTGKTLGACAHGFIGAVHALTEAGLTRPGHDLLITTSAGGSARASLPRAGTVMLHFVSAEPRVAHGPEGALEEIFHLPLPSLADGLPVLSVGSPKLTVEVTPDAFARLRRELDGLDYDRLTDLQRGLGVNGVHLFCRNGTTSSPEGAIQVNAHLGRSLVADRATGVSNAAQVSADPHVGEGQELRITQYTGAGRSAVLTLAKGEGRNVSVGGAAVLVDDRTSR